MKRQIKFRFWSYNTRCMYYDTGLTSLGLNDAVKKAEEVGYELMQFTGLLDKNGKEIYEGDIFDCIEINGTYTKGIVSFFDGCFVVTQVGAEGFIRDVNNFLYSEVIGNIYENPELL